MRKTAFMGVYLAFAIILGYVESLLPFAFGIPGVKLGLVNLAILLCMYIYGRKEALLINILRIVICALLFTNMYSMLYSLSGALLSFLGMSILKNNKHLSIVGISIIGGVLHNIGQILIAIFVTSTPGILYYAPILMISGAITGALLGYLAGILLEPLKKITRSNSDQS